METNSERWNEHQWSQPKPRRVEIESAKPLLQRHCIRCGRDFITDPTSGGTDLRRPRLRYELPSAGGRGHGALVKRIVFWQPSS